MTLSANEPATIYFRFSGPGAITGGGAATTAWQTYSAPVVILLDKNGSGAFEFYAMDSAGNVEATRTEVLQ